MTGELDDIASRLESIGEELADLAIDRLRSSLGTGDRRHVDEEKRLTRARRAVDKAVHLLRQTDDVEV